MPDEASLQKVERSRGRTPPFDPRLLQYSQSARRYGVAVAAFSVGTVIAVIAGAVALAGLLGELVTDPSARTFGAQAVHLAVIAAAFAARAGMSYLQERYAHRAALATIAELRVRALDALTDPTRTSPHRLAAERDRSSTILLRGLDALVDYLADYLPALMSTAIITPLVIVVIAWADWPSAVIIVITIPLIPLFMVLIGLLTRDRTERKLDAMSKQSSQLLDLLTGLPTLRAIGRAVGPTRRVDELGREFGRTTMSSLRIAFLSGAALEMLATLSVALVAVGIGLRLVFGDMSLYAGVLALVLAPEAYAPLRRIGSAFHTAQDGIHAARDVLDVCARTGRTAGARTLDVAGQSVDVDGIGIRTRDGWTPRGVSAQCVPGRVTVVAGPNGSGKSTLLSAILGLETPDEGAVRIGGVDVRELAPDDFHAQVAWLPQHPVIVPGTVDENLSVFGRLDTDAARRAGAAVGFDDVLADLPDGAATMLGSDGSGLSAGQRQRLALVRVLASDASLLLLDEPTAHLDDDTSDRVLDAIVARAAAGAIVVLVSHRLAALAIADAVVTVVPEAADVR
ncbi:thiol reductant ABC exporter subunit CydD [Gordonia sp. HY442]|uniref:thiol reductant ABC exporter subunit CydD n=1 Tax=Gordonia zhenghanii TaxID=2911516 RepID=UPI001F029481|nr:thiol reductant ABC exporter subunit CydD [Gordonia zhenghanii]MCF8603082.1 thiol reductant ABC exporter subunit CydD [Gordonia zhenghanii]